MMKSTDLEEKFLLNVGGGAHSIPRRGKSPRERGAISSIDYLCETSERSSSPR